MSVMASGFIARGDAGVGLGWLMVMTSSCTVTASGKGTPFTPGVIIVILSRTGSMVGGLATKTLFRAGTALGFRSMGTV